MDLRRLRRSAALVAAAFLLAFGPGPASFPAAPQKPAHPITLSELKNAEYVTSFDRLNAQGSPRPVRLKDGEFSERPSGGGAERVTRLSDRSAIGKIGGQELAAVVLVTESGSSSFVDLAAVVEQSGRPRNASTCLLGDRIKVSRVYFQDDSVVVEGATHGPQDPLCCPTQPVTMTFDWKNGKLSPSQGAKAPAKAPPARPPENSELISVKPSAVASWARGPGDSQALPKTVSFDMSAFARTAHGMALESSINNPDVPPFMNGEPDRVRFTFDRDEPADLAERLQRALTVYPVEEYAALFQGKERKAFDADLAVLRGILSAGTASPGTEIPVLPAMGAPQTLHAQARVLAFSGGSGVRFLTHYGASKGPFKDGEIAYTFQGLTSDGRYWVSLFCPVSTRGVPGLADLSNAQSLLGGQEEPPVAPPLGRLDGLVGSIRVFTPPSPR